MMLVLLMAGERNGASTKAVRDQQLRDWRSSETNKPEYSDKRRKNVVTFSDGCVFLASASAGDVDELQRLLDKGADINTVNQDGITALHAACIDNNFTIVEFLVKSGADVNRSDVEGWTPLHATASCGSLTVAKFLIDHGSDLSLVNNDGDLPLDLVQEEGAMSALLRHEMAERGVDGKAARNREERCMLDDVSQWLRDGRVEDVPHPKTGATALHVAAGKGYIRVIRLLLEAGVDVNSTDYDGWTPLHAAVHWGQTEAVELLCDSLADMDAVNAGGHTPTDLAESSLRPLLDELRRKQLAIRHNRKHKTSLGQREPPTKQRKESQTHNRDIENGPKENSTENGKVVNSASLDASEVQSWRRPSSLRTAKPPSRDALVSPRDLLLAERSLSSPAPHDDGPSDMSGGGKGSAATVTTTTVPLRRTVSFDRENRNTRDSAVRVSALQDSLLSSSTAFTSTTTSTTTSTSTTTLTIPSPTSPSRPNINSPTTLLPTSSGNIISSNSSSSVNSNGAVTTTAASAATTTPVVPNAATVSSTTTTTSLPYGSNAVTATTSSSPVTTTSNNTSSVSPTRGVTRSFVPPSRDDESETQRKANARLIRSSRRSTQGVSLDDLKTAETLYKPGTEAADAKASSATTTTTTTTTAALPAPSSSPTNGPSSKRQEEEDRRPSWRLKVDDNDKNRFCLEDVRGKDNAAITSNNHANGVQLRQKSVDDKREPEDSDSQSATASTQQSREGSQAAIQRRKKPKRRSTGVVRVEMDDIDPEKKAQKQQEPQPPPPHADDSHGTTVSERPGDDGGSSKSVSRGSSAGPDGRGELDYKKLYEEQLAENTRLLDRLRECEREKAGLLATADVDRREKRALERRLSEMEEDLRVPDQLQQDNKRLKDENEALIRVISKLSR